MTPDKYGHCVVSGASSQIGEPLLSLLANHGYPVTAISRQKENTKKNVTVDWVCLDIQEKSKQVVFSARYYIHLAPIWLFESAIRYLDRDSLKRVIVFSSTSVLSKIGSEEKEEILLVNLLLTGEKFVQSFCEENGIEYTILRPTMVYGYGVDGNISRIAKTISKTKHFFLVGGANGKRQPVHAEDLAQAVFKIMDNERTYGKKYELPGGETILYREMVEEIFLSMGLRPRIVRIPLAFIKIGIRILRLFGLNVGISVSMAERMNKDLSYSYARASDDFQYTPRGFRDGLRQNQDWIPIV